jgi:hypothetical protein
MIELNGAISVVLCLNWASVQPCRFDYEVHGNREVLGKSEWALVTSIHSYSRHLTR